MKLLLVAPKEVVNCKIPFTILRPPTVSLLGAATNYVWKIVSSKSRMRSFLKLYRPKVTDFFSISYNDGYTILLQASRMLVTLLSTRLLKSLFFSFLEAYYYCIKMRWYRTISSVSCSRIKASSYSEEEEESDTMSSLSSE